MALAERPDLKKPDRRARRFSSAGLAANSAVMAGTAGVATFAATGVLPLAAVLAGVGGIIGYSMINNTPSE
jgi:hypothetical protein